MESNWVRRGKGQHVNLTIPNLRDVWDGCSRWIHRRTNNPFHNEAVVRLLPEATLKTRYG